jgi:hypothetical protein
MLHESVYPRCGDMDRQKGNLLRAGAKAPAVGEWLSVNVGRILVLAHFPCCLLGG